MQAKFKVRHKTKMVPFCLNGKYIDKNNDKTGQQKTGNNRKSCFCCCFGYLCCV